MFPGMGFEPKLARPKLQGNTLTNCTMSMGKKVFIMYSNIYHCSLNNKY